MNDSGKRICILTVVHQWTKYSRYWIPCRMIKMDKIGKWMNDSDAEFRASEEIELTDNLDMPVFWNQKQMSVLLMKGFHTKELETNKNRKRTEGNSPITWNCNASSHSRENCLLESGAFYQFDESASVFDVYE